MLGSTLFAPMSGWLDRRFRSAIDHADRAYRYTAKTLGVTGS